MSPSANFDLHGHRALVIGGTRGIGRAISQHFVSSGATVLATYARDRGSADQFAESAGAAPGSLQLLRADITSDKGREALLAALDGFIPQLDCLVFSAATGVHRPFEALTERHFDFTFALNVKAFLWAAQTIAPRLRTGGSIIALSSEGAVHAMTDYALIGASKGALESMVRHLAAELGPRGVRVNALSPGAAPTEAWSAMPDAARRLADAAQQAPLRRLVTLDEIASAAHFLASPASSGITGQTIVVDGGARIIGHG